MLHNKIHPKGGGIRENLPKKNLISTRVLITILDLDAFYSWSGRDFCRFEEFF